MHVHDFDPVSGWCKHCTYRDDGRLVAMDPSLTRGGGTLYRPGIGGGARDVQVGFTE